MEKGAAGNLGYKTTELAQALNAVLDDIGKQLNNTDEAIRNLIHTDTFLSAMVVAYHIGGESDELMKSLRRLRCDPNKDCYMAGLAKAADGSSRGLAAYVDFFSIINKLPQYKGTQIPDDVWYQLRTTFKELGTEGPEFSKQGVGKAKGAVETFVYINRMLSIGGTLKRVEQKEVVLEIGDIKGVREYDAVFELNGKEIKFEVKAWNPKSIKNFFYLNFKGDAKAPDGEIRQLQLDLVNALKSSLSGGEITNLDNVNIRWIFDGRVGEAGEAGVELAKDEIIEQFIDKLADDEATLMNLIRLMGEQGNALSERLFRTRTSSGSIEENREQFFGVELPRLLDTLIISNR